MSNRIVEFVTWNIEGILNKLSKDFAEYLDKFSIFSLQETWDSSDDNPIYDKFFPNHTMYNCKAKESTVGGRSMGGVLVFVEESLSKFIKRILPEFEFGIMLIIDKSIFNLDQHCLYVSLYVPPECSPAYDQQDRCALNVLEDILVSNNLTQYYLIINGDLNARTGVNPDFVSYNENVPELREYADVFSNDIGIPRANCDLKLNKFGKVLLEFCKTYSCYIVNGRYGKDAGKGEFSFVSVNGCSTIDYFILSRKCLDLILGFEVMANVESSHFPVFLELGRKYVANVNMIDDDNLKYCRTKYNIKDTNSNEYINTLSESIARGEFIELENKLHNKDVSIDSVIDSFESIVLKCSEKFVQCPKKNQRKIKNDWYDAECKTHRNIVKRLLKRFRTYRTVENINSYIDAKKEYKNICKKKKYTYYKLFVDKMHNLTHNKTFWDELKKLTSRSMTGNSISNDQWFEHFSSLFAYRNENIQNENDSETESVHEGNDSQEDAMHSLLNCEITDNEVMEAVKHLNINKAASGKLVARHIKFGITALLPYIRILFNRLYTFGEFPKSWAKFVIVPLHKKGDLANPNNYRGISLLETLSKIYIHILNKRLTFFVEAYEKLSEAQSGFRSGYRTTDNAFVLLAIISKYMNLKKRSLYVAFIDFEKAFDSVERHTLYRILQSRGIRGNLFKAIESIYTSVKASVRANNTLTDEFNCPVGLRQGCPLSPMLFCLFINELHEKMKQEGIRGIQLFPDIIEVFILMFADDIALLADTVSGLQKQLNTLESFCENSKLKVNITKTKVVVFKRGGQLARREKWFYKGNQLEIVNDFTYVGSLFTNRLSLYKMADAVASKSKNVLNYVLNCLNVLPYLPTGMFFKIFDLKICPILLYGSELWGLVRMTTVEQVQIYACKRLLNVSRLSCNDAIMGDLGRYPMYIFAAKRCMKYWLRLLKLPNTRLVKVCYKMMMHYDNIGHTNWVTFLKNNLLSNGFGYIWHQQYVENEKLFLYQYTERLKNQYIQQWTSNCNDNHKLLLYKEYKTIFITEYYINIIDIGKFRSTMASFRSSSHDLEIEKGRHFNIPREFRYCCYCETIVEDEIHFVLNCPLYDELRLKYIDRRFIGSPCTLKFNRLMSSRNEEVVKNLSMYLYYAFKIRKEFIA